MTGKYIIYINNIMENINDILSTKGCIFIKDFIKNDKLIIKIFKKIKKVIKNIDSSKTQEYENYFVSNTETREGSKNLESRNKSIFNFRGIHAKGKYYDTGFLDICQANLYFPILNNLNIEYIEKTCLKINSNFKKEDLIFNIYYTDSMNNLRKWHWDDYNTIKFFIYLSDVNIENGPYSYIENSVKFPINIRSNDQLDDKEIDKILETNKNYKKNIFTGTKGDLIISLQAGIHRGQPQKKGYERMVLVIKYRK